MPNQARRRSPDDRARGRQIGSGVIERGGHPVMGARLTQAGLIWIVAGARAVAAVRTWLQSGRWDEALAGRPGRTRNSRHQAA